MDATRPYLTIRDTAALLALSTRTIHRYIAEGKLKAYHVAGEKVTSSKRQDVEALLDVIVERLLARPGPLRRLRRPGRPPGRAALVPPGRAADGTDAIAGRRLVCVHQSAGAPADFRLVPPAILWNLCPVSGGETPTLPADEGAVLAFAVDAALESCRRELLAERQREAAVKRKYGPRSLDHLLLESEAKLLDYATRRAKGERIPEPTIQHEERVKEDLLAKRRRLEALRLETTLAPAEPRIIGVAA